MFVFLLVSLLLERVIHVTVMEITVFMILEALVQRPYPAVWPCTMWEYAILVFTGLLRVWSVVTKVRCATYNVFKKNRDDFFHH